MELLERFLTYVGFDTQSDPKSETYPSTARQLALLGYLAEELTAIGMSGVDMDPHGYVTASLPASPGLEDKPVIAFIAHVDTSPDMSGRDVNPQIIENYDGSDIPLGNGLVLSLGDFPELIRLRGHTLITTDGTTLLGADDKAGIAIIMSAMEFLIRNPELRHPAIRVAFTPDEEIGKGVDHFDVEAFGARYAYTVDGSGEGEIEYENFNAAEAIVKFAGRNIHPGSAKDKMINALLLAGRFNAELPAGEIPAKTEGYEGFYHLNSLCGDVDSAVAEYIIRDHSREKFEEKKKRMICAAKDINAEYGMQVVEVTLTDQYYNMREKIEPVMEIVDRACEAMRMAGVEPVTKPIRGGTDGARLSYMGLPCPNIFTGGANFHGRYEYCSLDVMRKAVETVVNLAVIWGK